MKDDLDKEDCIALLKFALGIASHVDTSLGELRRTSSDAAFEAARRLGGSILGEVYKQLLRPIHDLYPEIFPTGLLDD